MMKLYISKDSLRKAVAYFEHTGYQSPEQLGLFLFFKSIGFNAKTYQSFPKMGSLKEEQKKEYLLKLYRLSGLFDRETEEGGKRNCLFPFSIHPQIEKHYFNPGTAYKMLLSRLRDTVDNTLIDDSKFLRKEDGDPDRFRFPGNYIQLIKNNFLMGERISLVWLAAWYFRFRAVQCPDEWITEPSKETAKAYTRVLIKIMTEELKLTQEELSILFYESEEVLEYQEIQNDGPGVRGLLSIKPGFEPEVEILKIGGNNYMEEDKEIALERTEELAQTSGDNITKDQLLELLLTSGQVVLYGPPGTGKSHITDEVKHNFDNMELVQFHPAFTYEQFIGGYAVGDDGNLKSQAGVFLEFCEEARENKEMKCLFVIDELNRGNISKIFGEVILALDRGYQVTLPYPVECRKKMVRTFSIPDNVYLLATMNSADRSIALVDYAIRRRFAFVRFYPNYELVSALSDCTALPDVNPGILLKSLNEKLFQIMKEEDLLFGHSYFLPRWIYEEASGRFTWTPEALKKLFNYYIIPMLEEYTYGNTRYMMNILGSELPGRINNTDVFLEELKRQFTVN